MHPRRHGPGSAFWCGSGGAGARLLYPHTTCPLFGITKSEAAANTPPLIPLRLLNSAEMWGPQKWGDCQGRWSPATRGSTLGLRVRAPQPFPRAEMQTRTWTVSPSPGRHSLQEPRPQPAPTGQSHQPGSSRPAERGLVSGGRGRKAASVVAQAEEAHAGGGLLDSDGDEVGGDVGDEHVLQEAAGRLPVLAGLHRH